MQFSHKENTLYVNGKVLNATFNSLLEKWDKNMQSRPCSVIAGKKAEELGKLTDLESIRVPSVEEQIEIYRSKWEFTGSVDYNRALFYSYLCLDEAYDVWERLNITDQNYSATQTVNGRMGDNQGENNKLPH